MADDPFDAHVPAPPVLAGDESGFCRRTDGRTADGELPLFYTGERGMTVQILWEPVPPM